MTAAELKHYFKDHLVPARLYSVGSGRKGRICMEKDKNGWDVYYRDSKDKVGLLHFSSEAEACEGMRSEIGKVMKALYGLSFTGAAG